MTPRPTQGGAPVRARTRGPVELTLEVAFGLIFVSLFAWFIGVMIELAGHYVLWKEEGALAHSQRIVAQDMGYIAAAPRSLLIDDTEGFAHRLNGWAAWPYERLGVLAWYGRTHVPGQEKAAPASQPKASAPQQLGLGLQNATRSIGKTASYWAVVSMHVAQDVLLRLSVALFALPAFALACIVGIVDGLVRRDLRRWQGGRESSFVYHHAKRYTAWALTGGFGLYLTWPFGGFNPAYMVLVFTVLVAATLSTTVGSFKKYV